MPFTGNDDVVYHLYIQIKTKSTSCTMFNADKFIGCSITFHFKDLKNNYGTAAAFCRPRQ